VDRTKEEGETEKGREEIEGETRGKGRGWVEE